MRSSGALGCGAGVLPIGATAGVGDAVAASAPDVGEVAGVDVGTAVAEGCAVVTSSGGVAAACWTTIGGVTTPAGDVGPGEGAVLGGGVALDEPSAAPA